MGKKLELSPSPVPLPVEDVLWVSAGTGWVMLKWNICVRHGSREGRFAIDLSMLERGGERIGALRSMGMVSQHGGATLGLLRIQEV